MHEFSIASNILETALEARDGGKVQIRHMDIKVGQLSSVVIQSLEMCMEAVLEDKGMQDVEVEITEVPARAICECGAEYEPQDVFCECPECGSFERDIIDGRQVILDSIEVEDGED